MSDYLWFITRFNDRHIGKLLESLQPDEDIELIKQHHGGKSLAWAWNQALDRIGKYKAVIISNDDVIVKPDTGKVITKALDNVGRTTNTLLVSAYDINLHGGDFGNTWIPSATMYPQSFLFAVDERLKQLIGKFDERFSPYLFEDTDMYNRVKIAGYDWATCVPVWHLGGGSTTTVKQIEERNKHFKINKAKYVEKWGGEPGKELWTEPKPKLAKYYPHATVSGVEVSE
jgi:hypothetical protein